jgi:hypothetical protein
MPGEGVNPTAAWRVVLADGSGHDEARRYIFTDPVHPDRLVSERYEEQHGAEIMEI